MKEPQPFYDQVVDKNRQPVKAPLITDLLPDDEDQDEMTVTARKRAESRHAE